MKKNNDKDASTAEHIDKYSFDDMDKFISENDKTSTLLIKNMMNASNISLDLLAAYLGCKPQSLRNKFSRDSFSLDDLLITALACGFSVVLKNNSTNEEHPIDPVDFFKPLKDDVLVRISDLENKVKEEKRAEYERLKNMYGFD